MLTMVSIKSNATDGLPMWYEFSGGSAITHLNPDNHELTPQVFKSHGLVVVRFQGPVVPGCNVAPDTYLNVKVNGIPVRSWLTCTPDDRIVFLPASQVAVNYVISEFKTKNVVVIDSFHFDMNGFNEMFNTLHNPL